MSFLLLLILSEKKINKNKDKSQSKMTFSEKGKRAKRIIITKNDSTPLSGSFLHHYLLIRVENKRHNLKWLVVENKQCRE